ncbi:UNVERIFIED_CONTAM: hypothetical protein GTU68_014792 [Idotea baltica]|nr:hypothetical protein [Idotea baltica]
MVPLLAVLLTVVLLVSH